MTLQTQSAQDEPTQDEVDRVAAWHNQNRVVRCNRELERIADELPGIKFRGVSVSPQSGFTAEAILGLAKLAMRQTAIFEFAADEGKIQM